MSILEGQPEVRPAEGNRHKPSADMMIPDVLHFTVINLGAFAATQVVDKRIISIPLTQAQRLRLAQMKTIDEKFFDVAYTISRYEGESN